jgi:hypothetical protein
MKPPIKGQFFFCGKVMETLYRYGSVINGCAKWHIEIRTGDQRDILAGKLALQDGKAVFKF